MLDLLTNLNIQKAIVKNDKQKYRNKLNRKYSLSEDGTYYDLIITGGVNDHIIRFDASDKSLLAKYSWNRSGNSIIAYNTSNKTSVTITQVLNIQRTINNGNKHYINNIYMIGDFTCYDFRKEHLKFVSNDYISRKDKINIKSSTGYTNVYESDKSWYVIMSNKGKSFFIKKSFNKKLHSNAKELAIMSRSFINTRYNELTMSNNNHSEIKQIIVKELKEKLKGEILC